MKKENGNNRNDGLNLNRRSFVKGSAGLLHSLSLPVSAGNSSLIRGLQRPTFVRRAVRRVTARNAGWT
jgi:hypothetical protein